MAAIWRQPYGRRLAVVCEDRPTLQELAGRGIRLELTGRDAVWIVELNVDDCERIAEQVGFRIDPLKEPWS